MWIMRNKKSVGQSLIEFALILPILLFILVIVADLARVIAAHIALSNASREGARYAASRPVDYAGIKNRVLLEYNNTGVKVTGVELKAENISVTYTDGDSTPGNPVRVLIRCRFPLFFAAWFPASVVDSNGTMLIERSAQMIIM
jgi:Flp pilus assembly protein TadG